MNTQLTRQTETATGLSPRAKPTPAEPTTRTRSSVPRRRRRRKFWRLLPSWKRRRRIRRIKRRPNWSNRNITNDNCENIQQDAREQLRVPPVNYNELYPWSLVQWYQNSPSLAQTRQHNSHPAMSAVTEKCHCSSLKSLPSELKSSMSSIHQKMQQQLNTITNHKPNNNPPVFFSTFGL